MSKIIDLDRLKRFYTKCKDLFASKQSLTNLETNVNTQISNLNSKLSRVYKIKGSVESYDSLIAVSLPEGYTQLAYLESSGTQWINTGVVPTIRPVVKLSMQMMSNGDLDAFGFNTRSKPMFAGNIAQYILQYYRYGSITAINTGVKISNTSIETYEFSNVVKKGNEVLWVLSESFDFSTNTKPILLFTGRDTLKHSVRIARAVIWDDTTKLRDLVPAKNSEGVLGLYDILNDHFYTNGGTGTFISGKEISSVQLEKEEGDVYNVLDTGANYVWTGEDWDKLSETIDLTPYLTKNEATSTYASKSNTYTKTEVNNLQKTKLSQFTDDLGSSPTHTHEQYAEHSEIPNKLSELTDDLGSNPIHTHNNYYTKTEVNAKVNEVSTEVADTLHAINGEGVTIDKALVVQEIGDAEDKVMSQKAVTDALAGAGGGTPSGHPMHDAFVSVGAVWNDTTKFWEMNMLTDLTSAEMVDIYSAVSAVATVSYLGNSLMRYFNVSYRNRTLPYFFNTPTVSISYAFLSCDNLVSLRFGSFTTNNISSTFRACGNLKYIIGEISFTGTAATASDRAFENCTNLELVKIKGLKVPLSFAQSSKLNQESILYIINNSAATSAITITLHPTAYAMAQADTEIQTALSNHPFVTLASA